MDHYRRDFSRRLKKIDRIHRRGGGFEAPGTLGQSYYSRVETRRQRSFLGTMLTVVVLVIGFKSSLVAIEGAEAYGQRVELLRDGGPVSQFAAVLMSVDPATAVVSKILQPVVS